MRRKFKKAVAAFLLLMSLGVTTTGSRVYAEENFSGEDAVKRVYRESSGDVEELAGYELSVEQAEKLLGQQEAQSIQWSGSSEEESFLALGSDYGYQDMLKRTNSAGRQSLYKKLEQSSRNFTLSNDDCTTIDLSDGTSYVAAAINIREDQLSSIEIMEAYFTFRNDNPQYFWLSNKVAWGSGTLFVLTYDAYQDGEARAEAFQQILQTTEEVYCSRADGADSDYGKVKAVHDALIADISYSADVNEETAHSIAGAMTPAKSAVCEGYAKVMQLMMNFYDISNIYVTGYGGGGAHAWNMVQMEDGNYYWLDATWDDQPSEAFQYQYFLVGNMSFADHVPDSPAMSGTSFLYELPAASDTDYKPGQSGGDPGESDLVRGDVTGDSNVDIEDLRMVLRAVCGKINLDESQAEAADVSDDGNVNIEDLRKILRFVCRKIEEL